MLPQKDRQGGPRRASAATGGTEKAKNRLDLKGVCGLDLSLSSQLVSLLCKQLPPKSEANDGLRPIERAVMLIDVIRRAAVVKGLAGALSCGRELTENSWKVFISAVGMKWLLLT